MSAISVGGKTSSNNEFRVITRKQENEPGEKTSIDGQPQSSVISFPVKDDVKLINHKKGIPTSISIDKKYIADNISNAGMGVSFVNILAANVNSPKATLIIGGLAIGATVIPKVLTGDSKDRAIGLGGGAVTIAAAVGTYFLAGRLGLGIQVANTVAAGVGALGSLALYKSLKD